MTGSHQFQDLEAVLKALDEELGEASPEPSSVAVDTLPHIAWQEHSEVYCETFVDHEAQQPKAYVSFKCMTKPSNNAAELLRQLAVCLSLRGPVILLLSPNR